MKPRIRPKGWNGSLSFSIPQVTPVSLVETLQSLGYKLISVEHPPTSSGRKKAKDILISGWTRSCFLGQLYPRFHLYVTYAAAEGESPVEMVFQIHCDYEMHHTEKDEYGFKRCREEGHQIEDRFLSQ